MNLIFTTEYQFLNRVFGVWLSRRNHMGTRVFDKKQYQYCFIVATYLLEFCRKNHYTDLNVELLVYDWLPHQIKSTEPSNFLLVDCKTIFLVIHVLTTCGIGVLCFCENSTKKTQVKNFLVFLQALKAFFEKTHSTIGIHPNFEILCTHKQLLKLYYTYRLTFQKSLLLQDPKKYYMGYRGSVVSPMCDIYYSSSHTVKKYIKTYGKESFKKKILGVYVSQEKAMGFEVHYHDRLNVADHCNFFNLAKQTTTGFCFNNTGRIQTLESNESRSIKLRGRKKFHSEEGLKRIVEYQKNERKRSAEEITGLREHTIARNKEQTTCPHCRKQGQLVAMKRWHFDNCPQKPNPPSID